MSDTQNKDLNQQDKSIPFKFDIANKYQLILDSVNDVIGVGTREHGVLYFTPSFTKETGWHPSEVMHKNLFDLAHPEDIPVILEAIKCLERDNEVTFNWRSKTKSGVYGWVETIVKNVSSPEDGCEYKVISNRNIQKRMELEIELRKTTEELSNLNKMKDKFFSIIAHDLKSPICSLITMTDFMQQQLHTLTKAEIEEFIASMCDSAKNSFILLENLLEWSRSQSGTIQFAPERIKLDNLIMQCWNLSKSQALNKKISFNIDIPPDLFAFIDYKMISTVIRNLISNALKFTRPGGKVDLAAWQENNNVYVTIKDNGIGMTKEQINYLFSADARKLQNDIPTQHGSGLGLILCKEFMDRHNGKISVESKSGHGSKITLTLPQTDLTVSV